MKRKLCVVFCTNCGTDWPEGIHFCGKCGIPLLSEPDAVPKKALDRPPYQQSPATRDYLKENAMGEDPTLWDDITSPIGMLLKYSAYIIGAIIVSFLGLIFFIIAYETGDGWTPIIKFLLVVVASISIYKILRMPETLEGIERSRKVTSVVVILVIVFLAFIYLGDDDEQRGDHYLEGFAYDVRNADYSSACSIMMESDGQFLSGNRLQSCIDEFQDDCGNDGCKMTLSILDTSDTGEKTSYTENVFEYKVRVSSESEGGASWCEIWYGAKNLESGEWGAPWDSLITENGSDFSSGEDVSC